MRQRILAMALAVGFLWGIASACAAGRNLRTEFANPPPSHAPAPMWWWNGEPLDRERLVWQLDQMKAKGVMNPCVIYVPTDLGEPPVWSDAWWDYWRWAVDQCKRRGMTLWFSDYKVDTYRYRDFLREHPERRSQTLKRVHRRVNTAGTVTVQVPDPVVSARAFQVAGDSLDPASAVDLRNHLQENALNWDAPGGEWDIEIICSVPGSSWDCMLPGVGKQVVDLHYAEFERRCPGELGKGIGGFFQDELYLWQSPAWSSCLAAEFERRKGYDLIPLLPALWRDMGPQTPKVRVDYYDVVVSLIEENYFRPIFEYMEGHGLLHSHDNWGRFGSVQGQTMGYGDYYRTMRWYSAPGYDDPGRHGGAQRNFPDAKLASSIAHLYRRPRVWCEGFHSSGHGASPADMMPWINANFAYGMTAYDFHGIFYTSYGGWWEWAPSSSCFRQPYWKHYDQVSAYVTRLCYLLSQGVHRCDVAILYPVTTVQADLSMSSPEGKAAEAASMKLGRFLFQKGMDLDYVDFESLQRAEIQDGALHVAGEEYQVLVLPATAIVRYATLEKALALYRAGGTVVAYGCLPKASERVGRDDPKLNAMVTELFGLTAKEALTAEAPIRQPAPYGGAGIFIPSDYDEVYRLIDERIHRDFAGSHDEVYVTHRVIDQHDVYFVFNARNEPIELEAFFRAQGNPELWDAWTGTAEPIFCYQADEHGTHLPLRLGPYQAQVIVFSPRAKLPHVASHDLDTLTSVNVDGRRVTVKGWARKGGNKTATVIDGGKLYRVRGTAAKPPAPIILDGLWEFEVVPTLDNRWGDFRWPPSPGIIGPEARQFRYAEETEPHRAWHEPNFDDSNWPVVTYSFGPYFWRLGPVPPGTETAELERKLAARQSVDPATPLMVGEAKLLWERYHFSKRWGIERDPFGSSSYGGHGLKKKVPDDFIDLGINQPGTIWYLWTAVRSPREIDARLVVKKELPGRYGLEPGFKPNTAVSAQAWLNGRLLEGIGEQGEERVRLQAGINALLLKFTQPEDVGLLYYHPAKGRLRAYVVLQPKTPGQPLPQAPNLGLRWFAAPNDFAYDILPQRTQGVGWYRFTAPPGLRAMEIVAHGNPRVWVDGREAQVETKSGRPDSARCFQATLRAPQPTSAVVAIRIEQEPGIYGGAAIPEPIALDCGPGRASLGQWSSIGLQTYSGAAWYRRDVRLTDHYVGKQIILDLGDVAATCQVQINDQLVGARVAPPWHFDISKFIRVGSNRIEVLVANTLGSHYSVGIPTRYVFEGQTSSGLLGPARLEALTPVELRVEQ